jgi:hypothetical protein
MNAHRTHMSRADTLAAVGSILYLHASFLVALWFLFDTWIGGHTIPRALGYPGERLQEADYLTVVSAIVGGSIGGVINGLRSALHYSRTFDHRYLWKYTAAPWMGAALSLLAYALMTTTAAVLGGDVTGSSAAQGVATATPQLLSNFAIGALAGYGSKDAFVWLDAQVHKLFAVQQPVPDVQGKPESVAMSRIESENLAVGAVAAVPVAAVPAGTVLNQEPAPGTPASRGDSVDITVAVDPSGVGAAAARATAFPADPLARAPLSAVRSAVIAAEESV